MTSTLQAAKIVAGNLIQGTSIGGCTTLVVKELVERVEPGAR